MVSKNVYSYATVYTWALSLNIVLKVGVTIREKLYWGHWKQFLTDVVGFYLEYKERREVLICMDRQCCNLPIPDHPVKSNKNEIKWLLWFFRISNFLVENY